MLPWHTLTCHVHDETFADALLGLLPHLSGTAYHIFSKLDWVSYLTTLVAESPTGDSDGGKREGGEGSEGGSESEGRTRPRPLASLAALLRLALEINLISPHLLPAPTRLALLGQLPLATDGSPASAASGLPPNVASQLCALHEEVECLRSPALFVSHLALVPHHSPPCLTLPHHVSPCVAGRALHCAVLRTDWRPR